MEVIQPINETKQFGELHQGIDRATHDSNSADDGNILSVLHNWTSPDGVPARGRRNRRKGAGGTRHQRIQSASEYRHKPYPEIPQALNLGERKVRRRQTEDGDRPRAPNNTNEFLMEYHENTTDPDSDSDQMVVGTFEAARRVRTRTRSESIPSSGIKTSPTLSLPGLRQFGISTSDDSINEDESSPEVLVPESNDVSMLEQNFEEIDFSKTYKNIHIKTLLDKSKKDLVKEVLALEKRNEILEKRLQVMAKPIKTATVQDDNITDQKKSEVDRGFIRCLQQEICLLSQENKRLKSEQQKL